MSSQDSIFSQDNPINPPPATSGSENSPEETTVQGELPIPDGTTDPGTIVIDGKTFSMDELNQRITSYDNLRADYTRKTQGFSEDRNAWEEEKSQYQQRMSELEAQVQGTQTGEEYEVTDDVTELNRRLAESLRINQQTQDTLQKFVGEAREARAQIEEDSKTEDALDALGNLPFMATEKGREDLKEYMKQNQMGPHQAYAAWQGMYGPRVGVEQGKHQALQEAASAARPVMGSSPTRVSPDFTVPQEIPGAQRSYEDMSMKDLARLAANDPNIPKGA